ncbi:MAG: thioredoxin family protein [Granulosicoccus sp.]|nr:thioredoxin family protein [Granulosicoccus sp.]
MNRRNFISTSALYLIASKLAFADMGITEYTPGLINDKLAAGETLLVDYSATWCSTCKRQERILNELRAENPMMDEKISFVKVDWDTYSSHDVTVSRNIPRRSTLILLRGDAELGRIVAGTNTDEIRSLLELGLADS